MKSFLALTLILASLLINNKALASVTQTPDIALYRSMTLNVRQSGNFKVPMPNGSDLLFKYQAQFGAPAYQQPLVADLYNDSDSTAFIRNFWDRIFFKDGSNLTIGTDQVPLTCIYIEGQDNRYSAKDSPLVPDFLMKVYLVANDFTCIGPVNPGWPENGAKKDTWDTYLYFEIRDPTIMMPTDIKIRYRWNEFQAVVVDGGPNS